MSIQAKEVKIADIKIGDRYRKDMGDIAGLAKSMDEVGLLHPIVVTATMELVVGGRRIAAAKLLDWRTIAARIINVDDMVRGEHDENVMRKDFVESEKVAIIKALLPAEKEAAKERQREHGKTAPGKKKNTSDKKTEVNKAEGEATTIAAKKAGMSRPTFEKADAVVEAAKKNPDKGAAIVAKMDKTGNVSAAYRNAVSIGIVKELENSKKNERSFVQADGIVRTRNMITAEWKKWPQDQWEFFANLLHRIAKEIEKHVK